MRKRLIVFPVIGVLLVLGCSKNEEITKPSGIQGTIQPVEGLNVDLDSIEVRIYTKFTDQSGFDSLVSHVFASGSQENAFY